jgi:PPM family protein phosphatase
MSLALRYSATSDVGRVRKNNQDSGFASGHLLVVADGMGGAAAGDIASAETIQVMRRLHDAHPDDMLGALAGAVQRANDRLGEIVEDDPSVEGMGTTVTAIMFDGGTMGLAHIGDSRAYLLRDRKLTKLTQDHTFVQGLVDEGRITEVEARSHPHRSLLLRALDGRHDAEPDLSTFEVHPGDRLLVCSDGLCGYIDDEAIERALEDGTPDEAALRLLEMALDAGGPDNITCVVGDVVDGQAPVDGDSGAAGPMVVGAAAERARHRRADDTVTQPAIDADAGGHGADPEELRYAPRAPRRFRWLRRLALLVVVLVLLGLAAKAAYNWTQDQYFVADNGDTVAIYRGIRADVPLVALSSLYSRSEVQLSTLPSYWRTRVENGIDATNLSNAHNIVRQLQDTARACAEPQPTPNQPSQPSARPSPSPEPTAGQSGNRSDRTKDRRDTRDGGSSTSTRGTRSSTEPSASPPPTRRGAESKPTPQPSQGPGCAGASS